MFVFIKNQKRKFLFSSMARLTVFILSFALVFGPSAGYAQTILNLPLPGAMVTPSPVFAPVLLKGMTVHPEDPFKFDFIIDSGNSEFTADEVKKESEKLVKYFLASMTVPEDDLWVNLSPYEQDRIVPEELGKTELGRDMLAQDYILKQLTASLMYPEEELGKTFWDKVYKKAREQYGVSEIPVNTFNKVWILPERAVVYEHGQTVYVVDAHLKVMLDSDYQAREVSNVKREANNDVADALHETRETDINTQTDPVSTEIIRALILPAIEKEVNEGANFAPLRQIYHSLILAKWYKETIKNSLLSQVYVDQNLIDGVDVRDKTVKDKIYARYIAAYKKGVFNYIKEDYDRLSNGIIPRKYFSGGIIGDVTLKRSGNPIIESDTPKYKATVEVTPQTDSASSPIPYVPGGTNAAYIERIDRNTELNLSLDDAKIYAEKVAQSKWYQQNLSNDLSELVGRISDSGEDVIVDASAGTAAASIFLLEQLRAKGKKIKKLILTDIDTKLSRSYMEYNRRTLKNNYKDVADDIEFYILKSIDPENQPMSFALLSDIPGLQKGRVNHVIFENAVHLIPEAELARMLKGMRAVMKPGGTLIMGSGDLGAEFRPEDTVGIHDLFDRVREKALEIIRTEIQYIEMRKVMGSVADDPQVEKIRKKLFPGANPIETIMRALEQVGFDPKTLHPEYSRTPLEREDYRPFITGVFKYVQPGVFTELWVAKKSNDFTGQTEEIANRAYNEVYKESDEGVFELFWTKFVVTNPGSSSSSEDIHSVQSSSPIFRDIADFFKDMMRRDRIKTEITNELEALGYPEKNYLIGGIYGGVVSAAIDILNTGHAYEVKYVAPQVRFGPGHIPGYRSEIRIPEKIEITRRKEQGSASSPVSPEIVRALQRPFKLIIFDLADTIMPGNLESGVPALEAETVDIIHQLRLLDIKTAAVTGEALSKAQFNYSDPLRPEDRAGQFIYTENSGRAFQFDETGELKEGEPLFTIPLFEDDEEAVNRIKSKLETVWSEVRELHAELPRQIPLQQLKDHLEQTLSLKIYIPNVPQEIRDEIAEKVRRQLGQDPDSKGINILESSRAVNVTRANKGVAVRDLANRLGIAEEDILILGDSALDDPMYKALANATKIYVGKKPYSGLSEDVLRYPLPGPPGARDVLNIVHEHITSIKGKGKTASAIKTSAELIDNLAAAIADLSLRKERERVQGDAAYVLKIFDSDWRGEIAALLRIAGYEFYGKNQKILRLMARLGFLLAEEKKDNPNAIQEGIRALQKAIGEQAASTRDGGQQTSSPVSTDEEVGGIDLNDISVDRQGSGVDIQFDPVELQEIIDRGITGFTPVIINLVPISSVLPLLGLEPKKEEEYELSRVN